MTRTVRLAGFVLALSVVLPALAGAAPVSEEKKAKCRLDAQAAYPGPGNKGKYAMLANGTDTQAKRHAFFNDCIRKP